MTSRTGADKQWSLKDKNKLDFMWVSSVGTGTQVSGPSLTAGNWTGSRTGDTAVSSVHMKHCHLRH